MNAKKFTPRRTQSTAEFRRAALVRLEERWRAEQENPDDANAPDAWEPDSEPLVTPLFKAVEGGILHVFDALRAHDDEDARAFLATYDQCSATDQKYLPLEYVAYAAGIGSLRLAEVAQTAIFLYDGMKTKLLLASGLPAIVAQSIKQAKSPRGIHDREMMLKAGGVLPVPKGAQIHIQNLQQGAGEKEEGSAPARPVWRESEARLREIHELTEPKRLPSPEARPIAAGGRLDHLQEDTIHILRED